AFVAEVVGDVAGRITVILDPKILDTPLLGEGEDQARAWGELLRESAEAAAGVMLANFGLNCRVETFAPCPPPAGTSHAFRLKSAENSWRIIVRDEVRDLREKPDAFRTAQQSQTKDPHCNQSIELLTGIELEASLRFGCREMPLREIFELG